MVFIVRNLSHFFIHILTLLFPVLIFAQSPPLSGIINTYTKVNSVDYQNNTITVENSASFFVGDTVLLIQMQGAEIAESDNSTYGNINTISSAGLYEMAVICAILGNNISFLYQINHNYTLQNGGSMQMISIPQYQAVTIADTLKAQPWNGSTGGVLILQSNQSITLDAPIEVSGQGFRGGQDGITDPSCIPFVSPSGYFYASNSDRGALKGEGIALPIVGKEAGRGKQANGGGGGNDHNTGGGGGSNYGAGGNGGRRVNSGICSRGNHPGLGGLSLNNYAYSATNNRIFMGGGGGTGHNNNGQGANGANGGGIIIIITDTLNGNGYGIYANGQNAKNSGSDGAPGGGGGGTILISANHITQQPLELQTTGGNGGNSNYIIGINCEGPGGGGGGGAIWSNIDISSKGNITTQVNGGANGISDPASSQCPGASNDATSGQNGAVLTGLSIPMETVTQNGCILDNSSIELRWAQNSRTPTLTWKSSAPEHLHTFEVQGRKPGHPFSTITTIHFSGQSLYHWEVEKTASATFDAFRIKEIGLAGQINYSNIVSAKLASQFEVEIFPNPVPKYSALNIHLYASKETNISMHLYNQTGSLLFNHQQLLKSGKNSLDTSAFYNFSKGIYFLLIHHEGEVISKKIIIQ